VCSGNRPLAGDEKHIVDTLKLGQLVFSIALGDLIEKFRGEVGLTKRWSEDIS
jgi:hypothetical protein